MTEEDLRKKAALSIPNFALLEEGEIQFLHLNITQDGYLKKWTFTAEDLGEGNGGSRTEYPDLRIIRPNLRFHVTAMTLHGSDAIPTEFPNVYDYTNDTMQFIAGDFIAIKLPPMNKARLSLSFVRNSGPNGIRIQLTKRDVTPVSGREGDLPLVTLEISNDIVTLHVWYTWYIACLCLFRSPNYH